MMRLPAMLLVALALLALAAPVRAVAPPAPMNAAEIGEALDRLSVLGTALYVAAHPDDENTALLAWLNHGRKVRTAYLAMTRGDGGQNLIGSEAGEQLGVIRTQELLAARRIDGAEQFFTRAIDFGYSKTHDETLEFWGHDETLADVVWVIRRFRPDVIVTRFGADGSGGHGHHTASALLANEAFAAAADPTRFPEQLAHVQPWQAKRIFWNTWRPDTNRAGRPKLLTVDLGEYNARLGLSYSELAGQSRSMHKSQGFGAPERRGTLVNHLEPTGGEPATGDPFDGVDLSWNRVRGGAKVEAALARARRAFDPARPSALVPALLEMRAAMNSLGDDPYVAIKRAELDEVIRSCAGLWVEAIAAEPSASPGGEVRLQLAAINRSGLPLTLERVELPHGAAVKRGDAAFAPAPLAFNQPLALTASVALPADAPITQPYWLANGGGKGRFEVASQALVGAPDNAPALTARFHVGIQGQSLAFEVPVAYRWTDRVQGERYRLLEVGPPVSLRFEQDVVAFPDARPVEVKLIAGSGRARVDGTLALTLPEGWRAEPASVPVALAASEERAVSFRVTPGAPGTATLGAVLESGGRRYDRRRVVIDHEHIPVQTLFPRAILRAVRADLKRVGDQVAYVMGSGDAGPDALRQMGYGVTLLSDDDLESADLGRFDAIVVGVRAYNTRPRLRVLDARLDDYVAQGGTVVVQYQTTEPSLQKRIGPFEFELSRDRVTVEEAPVRFADPRHPLLTTPNRITEQDFAGWVQERGLYFAGARDARFDTVLVSNDPGERPLGGGLIHAKHGRGVFVYTGYAFFRQLPAGVPGAWRLFANLVSARGERDTRRGAANAAGAAPSGARATR